MTDTLADDQSWRGIFWLPGERHAAQSGVLAYTPDRGLVLSLVGGFAEYQDLALAGSAQWVQQQRRRFPVIYGRIGSTAATLLDCRIRGSRSSGWVPEEQEIGAARMLKGVFLDDPDSKSFSELTLELENLTLWDNRGDLMVHTRVNDALPLGVAWNVTIDPVDPLVASVGDFTVKLARMYATPQGRLRRDSIDAGVRAASYLIIASQRPKSIAQWAEVAKQFQDMITFAMDTSCATIRETLTPSDELRADATADSQDEIALYSRRINTPVPNDDAVELREALFTLATEGITFEAFVPRWVEVNNRFRAAFDMIVGLRYVRRGYLQSQLITVVAAAESIYAAMDFAPPMPAAEFKALKKSLLEAVPEDRRQWLREKLGSNRATLVRQLVDLAQLIDIDVRQSLVPDIKAWATATKKERNPVAHGGNRSTDVQLLSAITTVTEAVVIINLLQLLGIPTERLKFVLVDNPRIWAAVQHARQQWSVSESNEQAR